MNSEVIYKPLPYCGILLLHDPGAGGQFLSKILVDMIIPKNIKPYDTQPLAAKNPFSNEFYYNYQPLIVATHFQVLFRDIHKPDMKVTLSRYKEVLDYYKYGKIISLSCGRNYQDFIRILGDIKLLLRDEDSKMQLMMSDVNFSNTVKRINQWKEHNNTDRLINHRWRDTLRNHENKFLYHANRKDIKIFNIDYESLFINFNKDKFRELSRFVAGCNFVSESDDKWFNVYEDKFNNYYEQNLLSIDKFLNRYSNV